MNAPPIETDALIVGAGPVGLFQVFELGLLEVKAHVVDALPYPGGQCVELYADKPIYDIPGLPVCSGQELVNNLLRQIKPFGATFHLQQQVTHIQKQADGRFLVGTSQGSQFMARTIFIAAGVGAFQPRTLTVDGLTAFDGSQIFYNTHKPTDFAGKNLVILGDGDAAIDAAIDLAGSGPHRAQSVILIHRRDSFKAAPSQVDQMRALCAAGQMQFIAGQVTGFETTDKRLSALQITGSDGLTQALPLDTLLALLGLSPKLGPIADWGLDLERKQLKVDTECFSTSEPGIFAVGDINSYPGKKKLILCGFHEATLAAFGAMALIAPEKKVFLQYTTTSPKLHKVLGVAAPQVD
ncbi:MAG: thioredoxin reductase (NADPH) [Rhodoferax sp.]|jgi:thioredoxin reductase (NADPH)